MIYRIAFIFSIFLMFTASVYAQPLAFVSHLDTDNVLVIDTETSNVVGTIPVNISASNIIINNAGTRAYVLAVSEMTVPSVLNLFFCKARLVVPSPELLFAQEVAQTTHRPSSLVRPETSQLPQQDCRPWPL